MTKMLGRKPKESKRWVSRESTHWRSRQSRASSSDDLNSNPLVLLLLQADTSLAEWCHLPVIQSGGAYDIKWSGQSSEGKLDGNESAGNVVIANLGVKYKSYCSWVGRTFCIDPHKVSYSIDSFLSIHYRRQLVLTSIAPTFSLW